MGVATTNESQRIEASLGMRDIADTQFEPHNNVLNAGVLLGLPALLSQGLDKALEVYDALPSGYYGLHHIVLLSCFMALCRIRNVEQLKGCPPGELGKLIGLDRVPEVGHLRKKFQQIFIQEKTDELQTKLFSSWLKELPELFFYIDGHVRVYHGSKANLTKRYVSREKLCLNGTTEFWVNDQTGQPLMFFTGELNEKLKDAIEQIIVTMKSQINSPEDPKKPRFTIVIDRESYEPKWYKHLWNEHQIAVITYRKNVKDKWAEDQFTTVESYMFNNEITMQICEQGVLLNDCWFREIRSLSSSSHQTSIITTHPQLDTLDIAVKMFSRWSQENFFKYLIANFDFDKMVEYGTEKLNPELQVVNPEYRQISYKLKRCREKKRRLEAKVFEKIENNSELTIETALQNYSESSDDLAQIDVYKDQISEMLYQRKQMPSKISIADMPQELRFNKLKQEGKKYKNVIIMIAYRAETALYNLLPKSYKNASKEGRALIREIFTSDADLIPDYKTKTLTVSLHSLSTPRSNKALIDLCHEMNETETCYPHTELRLIFKSVAE